MNLLGNLNLNNILNINHLDPNNFGPNNMFNINENFDNILIGVIILFLLKEGGEDMITVMALVLLLLS